MKELEEKIAEIINIYEKRGDKLEAMDEAIAEIKELFKPKPILARFLKLHITSHHLSGTTMEDLNFYQIADAINRYMEE